MTTVDAINDTAIEKEVEDIENECGLVDNLLVVLESKLESVLSGPLDIKDDREQSEEPKCGFHALLQNINLKTYCTRKSLEAFIEKLQIGGKRTLNI